MLRQSLHRIQLRRVCFATAFDLRAPRCTTFARGYSSSSSKDSSKDSGPEFERTPFNPRGLRMLQHQHRLPTLPVPSLAASTDAYRASIAVYASAAELEVTDAAIASFLGSKGDGSLDGEAAPLQRELLARAAKADADEAAGISYIGPFWEKVRRSCAARNSSCASCARANTCIMMPLSDVP